VYTVSLTVTDEDGSVDTVSFDITVLDLEPSAQFIISPALPLKGSPVSFTDKSSSASDAIVTWNWDFGGEGSSYIQNPSFTFTEEGVYTVSLTVTDDDGSTDTVSQDITVVKPASSARFSADPESQDEGLPIQFTDNSVSPVEIESWSWDFGGEGTSTQENPEFIFMKDGVYTVSLTVTDENDSTDTDTHDITVSDVKPIASFRWSPDSCNVGTVVTFTDKSSCYPDEIVSCEWDFGDGSSPCDDLNPTHTYNKKGTYNVKLTVKDIDGDTDTASFSLTVAQKPLPLGLIGAVLIIGAATAYYFLVMKKQNPVTTTLRVTINPDMLPADGRSTAQVTVEMLNTAGNLKEVDTDTAVIITTSLGNVRSPVAIMKGSSTTTTILSAGVEIGTAQVTAKVNEFLTGAATIQLVENRRYCMHCGSKIAFQQNICSKCGKVPPSGEEVKTCRNCGAVIPSVARFCGECGAGQPENTVNT